MISRCASPATEKILALDGREYTLDDGMSVIADANGVHGIGGIMGGEDTGCTEETTNVFLEVALFDPIRTATTGRRLGIESDARYRFERGLDPESAYWGAEVATRLILEFCGGEASELTIAGEMPDWARPVSLRPERLKSFGGVDVETEEALSILDRLGFKPEQDNGLIKATTPSWRADVSTEYCLIEEVLRVKGFDEIPAVPMERETSLPNPAIGVPQRRAAFAKRTLAQRGMMEAVTWSFMPGSDVDLFGGIGDDLRLANPISADLDVMRPSILPNLVAAAKRNADRGYPDAGLFEVGPAYRDDSPSGQDAVAAGLRHGNSGPRHWRDQPTATSVFDAKADACAVLASVRRPSTTCRSMPKHPHGITRADRDLAPRQGSARVFRRDSSADLAPHRRSWTCRRVRSVPRPRAPAETEGWQSARLAQDVSFPAGPPRLRLRCGSRCGRGANSALRSQR